MATRPEERLEDDPRTGIARRGLLLSWTFYSVFLATTLGAAAAAGGEPLLFGLPRWVAVACGVVPAVFVVALIPIVETLVPDVSLADEDEPR